MGVLTFRSGIAGCAVALALALGLGGCVPTPGPGDYSSAAYYREQQAQRHGYQAQRDQSMAQWQAANGNYGGASEYQARAQNQADAAQRERAHANRDSWLSSWGW